MSRKTKIAVPPGTKLDWDDENHRRHLEDEAFAEAPWVEQPRPSMKAPERGRFWWFWRFYGFIVYVPLLRLWRWYYHAEHKETGYTHRFKSAKKLQDWMDRGGKRTRLQQFFIKILHRLRWPDYRCPHCGYDDYHDEHEVWVDHELVRTINLFEMVSGGGVDYWGEANDCHGWQWCWRCGDCSWNSI